MGIGENIENISRDSQEFVKRSIDSIKLHFVENLSLLLGDLICGFIVFVLLFAGFLLLLGGLVVMASPFIGPVPAMLLAILLLLVVALCVYMCRTRLFVDRLVARLVEMLFQEKVNDD